MQIFGRSLRLIGFFPLGNKCGRLFAATDRKCISGAGDPYLELNWSRHFGTARQSSYPGAYPIADGLTLQLRVGTVVPVGSYSASNAATHGLTIGNNFWGIAPMATFTCATSAIFANGAEFSAKLYWNNYLENSVINYQSGSLINVDFALTERIGKFQGGWASVYVVQLESD